MKKATNYQNTKHFLMELTVFHFGRLNNSGVIVTGIGISSMWPIHTR